MIRVLIYLLILAALAYGGVLLVQNPGHVTLTWFGEVVEAPAALIIGAIALSAVVAWTVLRVVFGLPSFLKFAARQRRREKGYQALSRGLVAVGAGDGRTAGKAASQANRHLKDDPLAIMLRAQAAHMNGEGYVANAAFEELAQRDDTRVLGLRGLHAEAVRRGDEEAARHFAAAAHEAAALPWSAQAVLEHRASSGDWEQALATVESSLAARLIDKDVGERHRAVLETAIAYDKEMVDPEAALLRARSAIKRAPDLAPPVVLAARLLSRRGDIRKASKLIERVWPRCQHPDIAEAYMDVRPGDSTQDRLTRAKTLMGIATFDPVSRTTVARAALANTDFAAAREAMAPLIAEGKRPTVRQCLLMAELEEAEHGDDGLWREWVARASRAPLDPAWVCEGTVYDHWAPASPKTGQLDAFHWQVPAERLGPAIDALPIPRRRPDPALPAAAAAALTHHIEDARAPETSVPDAEPPARTVQPKPVEPIEPAKTVEAVPLATRAPAPEPVAVPATAEPTSAPPPAPSRAREPVEPAAPVATEAPKSTATHRDASEPTAPPPAADSGAGRRLDAMPAAPRAADTRAAAPRVDPLPTAPTPRAAETVPPEPSPKASWPSAAPDPGSVNPRIHLPPEIEAEQRNPTAPRSLFHRRVTPEVAPAETPGNKSSNAAVSDHSTSKPTSSSATTGTPASSEEPGSDVTPNPRISLPPETVPEGRNPGSERSLFHRRLTPEAEALAQKIETKTNGASGGSTARIDRSTQANGTNPPQSRPAGATPRTS